MLYQVYSKKATTFNPTIALTDPIKDCNESAIFSINELLSSFEDTEEEENENENELSDDLAEKKSCQSKGSLFSKK